MPLEDKSVRLRVMREIAKRQSIDPLRLQVSCINQICTISGDLRAVRGARGLDTKKELATIEEIILRLPGIREVVTTNVRCR
ncbi:MAG: hypothetical protein PVH68_02080 [Armatimonadota bacterium]|jgi:hypothetical protein